MTTMPLADSTASGGTLPAMRMVQAGAGQTGDVFGVWLSPASGGAPAEHVFWQADLPPQASQAQELLAANQRLLERAGQALPLVEQGLAEKRAGGAPQTGQSFTAPWDGLASLPSAAVETARFFNAMRLALAPTASVQTSVDGRLIGRTQILMNGSFSNLLAPRLNAQQAARHYQVVSQALFTRQAVMRMGVLIAGGGASLASGAFAGPLSLLLVFQFVRNLIADVQQFGPDWRALSANPAANP